MADYIPTTGPWDEDDFTRRSISTAPARPIASINGTVVSVCSPDALADLNVIITDRQGHVVYQQPHTFTAGETIDLPALEEGEYIIVLSLGRRYLLGEFEVE
ncbi:DUF3244 domain-containing protein [Parabacteroides sp. PF5-6]|uniref:DUF3244 domain-containing protein n=1 Tax=Parabacteroides sp. PF5-6 TaxID=1742403 RepID=UPI0024065CEA|nr:DUF3244 domain-containing protein [Parabacteroides sp. PF5-6]